MKELLKKILRNLQILWVLFCAIGTFEELKNNLNDPSVIFSILFLIFVPLLILQLLYIKISKSTSGSKNIDIVKQPNNQNVKAKSNYDVATSEQSNHITEKTSSMEKAPSADSLIKVDTVPTNEQLVGYVETENMIYRTDKQPISDEEVPYLMEVGYESALEGKNIQLKRTSREEDLRINFMMNHSYDIQHHVDKFEDLYRKAYAEKKLNLKIKLLEQTICEYDKAKKWFYRTKGGAIYFEDMYEHLHNSRNNDFSYIDSVQDELEYCIDKRDITIPQILSAIGSNGIIQKDIYELVDSDKSDIQMIIRELVSENKIKREKKGNSYLLTLVK